MFKRLAPRLLNVALRALAMGSRFALIIVLAKLIEPVDLGLLGLILATIAFGVLVIGGDYYTYSQRELLAIPKQRWSFVLQHQAIATSILYITLMPALLLLFSMELLPIHLVFWFYILLTLEHVAQEINRLLVAMQRPLLASWILFLRMGAWVWALLMIMWLNPEARTLEVTFQAWAIGVALAIIVGMRGIHNEVKPWRAWPLDRAWLMRGFKTGLLFLLATLSFKALTTIDRFIFQHINGLEMLGVYVLYAGMAMAIINFMDAAVFSFLYPRLISAHTQGDDVMYTRIYKEMIWSTIVMAIGIPIIIALIAPHILHWTGRQIYNEHLSLLWLLLIASVIYSISTLPHFGLYAKKNDRIILAAHLSALIIFIGTIVATTTWNPLHTVPLALIAAFTWIGCFKLYFYVNRPRNKQNVSIA